MTLSESIECTRPCTCHEKKTHAKMIAVTGGPGAGKTTFLDLAKRIFCHHVAILPEAASIIYAGGFPRSREPEVIKAAQRSLWYVMRELEHLALGQKKYHVVLCDRGSLDGPAYWPEAEGSFFTDLHTTPEKEVARYDLVLHLRTPSEDGYIGQGTRNENLTEALELDRKTEQVWKRHPKQVIIESTSDFYQKMETIRKLIDAEIPICCKS